MERAVYVGRRSPPSELADALADSGFDVTAAVDLAGTLDALERHRVDCVLLTGDDPASQATRLRRRGHAQPALALVGPDDRLPDGAALAAVAPADDPERVAARARDVVDDRRLRRTRQRRARRTAALADARAQLPAAPDGEAVAALVDRLVGEGVYTGGWIGRHEASTDVVVPVSARGVSLAHLGTVTTTDGDEPVVRALEDGVATTERDDTAVLASRIGDGPFVLVCYGDRPNGIAATEREELHAFADRSPTAGGDDTDDGTGEPTDVDEAVRVLGDAFEHELSNHLDVAGLHLDLAEGDDHLDRVAAALDRMNELADEARRLARADVETEFVEVGDVARRAWERIDDDEATLTVDPDGRVDADPELLALLFENLFRNSVQHAGPAVDVTVAVEGDGFRVDDDGPGIPEPEREDVLEWGYSTDGTGVGLGVVALVAERHGWDVSVGESAEGGARIEFT
jgi:two-component sensor histidine kinase